MSGDTKRAESAKLKATSLAMLAALRRIHELAVGNGLEGDIHCRMGRIQACAEMAIKEAVS